MDQLKRRGFALANGCFICKEEETIDHLLRYYSKARILWDIIFSFVGVRWVFSLKVRRSPFLLAWFFCGQEMEKDLDGDTSVHFLDHLV